MPFFADTEAGRIIRELVAARQRLTLLVVLHVRLVREVLAVGDGKHHHADAREDVAVIVGQGAWLAALSVEGGRVLVGWWTGP